MDKMDKVVVSGGTGFIGSHLVKRLVKNGNEVHVLSRVNSRVDVNSRLGEVLDLISIHRIDYSNLVELNSCLQNLKPTIIYHIAGGKFSKFDECYATNFEVSKNLADSALNCNLKSFVFLSTAELYAGTIVPFKEDRVNPKTPYASSKYLAEIYLNALHEAQSLPTVIIRPFIVYGPTQDSKMFIPDLITSLISKSEFKMSGGKQTRDFIFVEDLVNLIIKSSNHSEAKGEVFNAGSGVETKIKDLAKIMGELIKSDCKLDIGALQYRKNEIWKYCADISRANEILDWRPVYSLNEGIKRTINFYISELKS